jgi:hypothetical protein
MSIQPAHLAPQRPIVRYQGQLAFAKSDFMKLLLMFNFAHLAITHAGLARPHQQPALHAVQHFSEFSIQVLTPAHAWMVTFSLHKQDSVLFVMTAVKHVRMQPNV